MSTVRASTGIYGPLVLCTVHRTGMMQSVSVNISHVSLHLQARIIGTSLSISSNLTQ
jgi:hypothetical protein